MKIPKLFRALTCIFAVSIALAPQFFAQTTFQIPRQEKLLNGLRVLMWSDPSATKVVVKLRVHSGASFDPQGKEGVMRLLSEALFPNETARSFFREDLEGDLSIECNYDYVEITASSKPDGYLSLIETLADSVINPMLDNAVTAVVKTKVASIVAKDESDPAFVADLEVRKLMFQTFPYGRPVNGSSESLKRIDFADLRFAYDRLFGSDNATLTVSGNFPADIGYRAIRRSFGVWLKSDRKVPSTFRQPDPPPTGVKIVPSPVANRTEIRFAIRGVSRLDKDHAAAAVLACIFERRLREKAPEEQRQNVFVRNESHILPGIFIFAFTNIKREITAEISVETPKIETNDLIAEALSNRITETEFSSAKSAVLAATARVDAPTRWLDVDTYRLTNVKADQQLFEAVTLSNVQTLADNLRRRPIATILVLTPTDGK